MKKIIFLCLFSVGCVQAENETLKSEKEEQPNAEIKILKKKFKEWYRLAATGSSYACVQSKIFASTLQERYFAVTKEDIVFGIALDDAMYNNCEDATNITHRMRKIKKQKKEELEKLRWEALTRLLPLITEAIKR